MDEEPSNALSDNATSPNASAPGSQTKERLKRATVAAVRWSAAKVGVSAGSWAEEQERPEPVSKRKKYGFIHAVVMIMCFGVLISTAYTQQQPSRYTKSHISLREALSVDAAKEVVTSDDIWEWLEGVVTGIGGKVVDHIEVNCAYDDPYTQDVSISGQIYKLLNPEIQTSACDKGKLSFVKGNGAVYLTGNHQLLSFGIFSDRSVPERPIEKSNSATYDIEVLDEDVSSLNPVRDEKVIQVCNDTSLRRCVLRDAPDGQIGSTLGWEGYELAGKYYFAAGSTATIFSATEGTIAYEPCNYYSGNPTESPTAEPSAAGPPPVATAAPTAPPPAQPTLQPTPGAPPALTEAPTAGGPPGPPPDVSPGARRLSVLYEPEIMHDTCEYMWVTSGYDMRITCITDRSIQQSARLAFVATYYDYRDIFGLFSGQFGCDSLAGFDADEIQSNYAHGHKNLEAYLSNEDSYGVFFSTTSQVQWVVESTLGLLNLQRNYFIDDNTRVFKVYMIARNLGREQLFYSFVTVVFYIDVDGLIRTEFDVTYVPMIQYYYGIDNYVWRAKEVFIFELMLVFLFTLFTLREVYQLLMNRLIPMGIGWKQKYHGTAQVYSGAHTGDLELQERNNHVAEVVRFDGSDAVPNAAVSKTVGAAQANSSKRGHKEDRSAKDIHEALDNLGDAIEDVLDDYVPDAAGMMDILDWMTIVVILIAIIYRIKYIGKARDLHNIIKSLEAAGDSGVFDANLETLIGKFAELASLAEASHLITIVAVCVGILQFFRYLSFDRKLGIVTETIYVVFFDLLPVLFIFITIVIAYGVLGTEIYGAHLREWSTLNKSIGSLFLMMLGEYGEYWTLRDVSPVETGIFFWSFVVIISMILFNMVLAVILTVYEDKYKELTAEDAASSDVANVETKKKQ